jgi:hydroxyquinol 1,2-dioxygenase
MSALVRHLHAFAREVRLTEPEWMAAIQWLNRTGQISNDKREEFILASDVLGLSMLVVQMNHDFDPRATPATVLGPFHIEGSPELKYGEDMSQGLRGEPLYLHGVVRDLGG